MDVLVISLFRAAIHKVSHCIANSSGTWHIGLKYNYSEVECVADSLMEHIIGSVEYEHCC